MGLFNINFTISKEDAEIIAEVIEEKYSPTIRGIFYEETKKFFGEGEYVQLFDIVETIGGKVGKIATDVADEFGNSANHKKFDGGSFQGIHGNINEVKEKVEKLANVPETLQTLTNKVTALEKLPADLETLKTDVGTIKNFSADFETLKTDVAEIKDFKNILQSLQGDIAEIKKFATDLQTLKNDNAILKNNLDTANRNTAEILRLFNESIKQQQEQVTALTGEVEKIKAEKTQLEGKISMLENNLQSKETDLNKKTTELEQAQADLKKTKEDLTQAEKTAETLRTKLSGEKLTAEKNSKALDAWRNKTNIYAPIRDALKNCPTFAPIVEKYHLADDDSEVALFTFAQVLGFTESFSYEVYQIAVNHKKNNQQLMTQDEIAVYAALNKAYRTIWSVDFDIFVTPAGKSVTEPFVQENFDKKLAVNLKDPRNRDVSKINGIYVPMLRNKSGEYSQSAYVDAANR